ncbi:MAG: NC domain-containing protein [Okeania sp. SIO2D1]|nr:NC domain-containing protein [Okeania sp. SIO2D1]
MKIKGVYEHHGIDYGDGSVIHYRKTTETIARTPLNTFSHGQKIYLKSYKVCYIPDVVLQRATSRLGEQQYNILFNNCEHFATWCKIGKNYSKQVEDFAPTIARLDPPSLYQPINQAFQDSHRDDAPELLAEALADIKVIWESSQPVYQKALEEMNTWQQVAMKALKKGREDLAKAALQRKLKYSQLASQEQEKLDRLAQMTKTLLRNKAHLQINLK